jgi:hypothetical protein
MRVLKDEDGGVRNFAHSRQPMLRLAITGF